MVSVPALPFIPPPPFSFTLPRNANHRPPSFLSGVVVVVNSPLPAPRVPGPGVGPDVPDVHQGVVDDGAVRDGLLPDDADGVGRGGRRRPLPDLRPLPHPHRVDHLHHRLPRHRRHRDYRLQHAAASAEMRGGGGFRLVRGGFVWRGRICVCAVLCLIGNLRVGFLARPLRWIDNLSATRFSRPMT